MPYPAHLLDKPNHMLHRASLMHSWHLRLNHTHPGAIRSMARQKDARSLPQTLARQPPPTHCHSCSVGHMAKLSRIGCVSRPPPRQTLTIDIVGPLPKKISGHHYVLTCTEFLIRYKLSFLLHKKQDSERCVEEIMALLELHCDRKPVRIPCENSEFSLNYTHTSQRTTAS